MGKNYSRLTDPLIKENGSFRAASWPEAIDRVASGFRSTMEEHPGSAFGMFSCSKASNEMNFMAQKFSRVVLGSNNIDSCNRT